MDFNHQLLFFFSALGAFNGLLLCFYFLFLAKPKDSSNIFLGLLLGALSIRIGKSTFFYFNPELAKIYLQFGLSACFFIGPFLYLHLKSKLSNEDLAKKRSTHFLLAILFLFVLVGVAYPYQTYSKLWGTTFYKIINYQWLVFIIASAFLLKDTFKKVIDSKTKLDYNEFFLLSIFIGVSAIWLAYYTSAITSYIVGALSFSFILYITIFLLYFKNRKTEVAPEKKQKYANKKIEETEAALLLSKIETLMKEQELYKDSNLTLTKLAKKMNVRPHLLSQLLNDNLNKSLPQFINEYRIEEAKRMLVGKSNLKMTAIAEVCGFNSNSTFYAAFKKVTNTTPAEYLKNY